jgi:hypothetical protein
MEKGKLIQYILIDDFMRLPDVVLKSDTALPRSLLSRCFSDSSFLIKARSACGNISVAPSTVSSAKCSCNNTALCCVLQGRSTLIGGCAVEDAISPTPHFDKAL